MRIAIDLRTLLEPYESGVAIYTKEITRALLKIKDLDLDLFYQAREKCERIHKLFPKARHIAISNTTFHLKSLLRFPNLPKDYFEKTPDIIFIPDRRPFYKTETPVVMTVHDYVPERFTHTLSFKGVMWHKIFSLNRLKKLLNGLTFPTESVAQEQELKLPHTVTYEGARLNETEKEMKLPQDFILGIMPSDPRKRGEWVLKLAKELPSKNFVIAGRKPNDPRFKSTHEEEITNLHFTGQFSEEEKRHLLNRANCLLAISEYEGFDLPILEAVQANCPVIMSDIPVHRELYSEGTFIKTYEQLKSAIELNQYKVPVAKQQFTWESAAERLLLFLNGIVVNKDS